MRSLLVEIYTLTSRSDLNREYYGRMLAYYQRLSIWLDTAIAVGTTGSGVSALTIWDTAYGAFVWGVLSTVSAVLALSKPIFQLNKQVERLSKLFAGHATNYATLVQLASRIRRREEISDEMIATFEAAEAKFVELSQDDDPSPNMALATKCETIVRKRHPPESAWYPTATR